jgi:hypothetical protein
MMVLAQESVKISFLFFTLIDRRIIGNLRATQSLRQRQATPRLLTFLVFSKNALRRSDLVESISMTGFQR